LNEEVFTTARKTAQDTIVYGLGEVGAKGIAFLLIPLYTRYLTPADYSLMNVVLLLTPLLADLANLSIISAFIRFYFDQQSRNKDTVTSTAFIFNIFSTTLFVALIFLLAPAISLLALGDASYLTYFRIGAVYLLFFNIGRFGLALFRVQRRPGYYAVTSLTGMTLTLTLTIVFVAVLHKGVSGILLGQLLSAIVLTAFLLPFVIIKQIQWLWSLQILKEMLSFSLPLLPINISARLIAWLPVPLIARLSSLAAAGLYSLATQFAMGVSLLVVQPFQLGWSPIAYSIAEDEDPRPTYSRMLTYYSLIAVFAALGISLLSRDVIKLVATPAYYLAYQPIFLLAMGYVLLGVFTYFAVIFNTVKKTYYSTLLWSAAVVVFVLLSLVLIPPMGNDGAAIANVAAYSAITAAGYFVVQNLYPVHYEMPRLAKIFGTAIALYLVGTFIAIDLIWASLIWNLALLCSYPLALYLIGFYRRDELARILTVTAGVKQKSVSLLHR
jgi:O-antigen/teichoic acid export membrane protein